MLTLTRKDGEAFRIGDALVFIKIVSGHRAKLHIEAPRETNVVRGEIAGVPLFGAYMQDKRRSAAAKAAG
jgi:carbon storage regulator CsrA